MKVKKPRVLRYFVFPMKDISEQLDLAESPERRADPIANFVVEHVELALVEFLVEKDHFLVEKLQIARQIGVLSNGGVRRHVLPRVPRQEIAPLLLLQFAKHLQIAAIVENQFSY